jgi:hypothetical protein
MPHKPVSYYISKKKYRKLHLNEKFKRFKLSNNDLSNILFSIKPNGSTRRNDTSHDGLVLSSSKHDDDNIILDLAIYKAFLYVCTLGGTCCVYNLNVRFFALFDIELLS